MRRYPPHDVLMTSLVATLSHPSKCRKCYKILQVRPRPAPSLHLSATLPLLLHIWCYAPGGGTAQIYCLVPCVSCVCLCVGLCVCLSLFLCRLMSLVFLWESFYENLESAHRLLTMTKTPVMKLSSFESFQNAEFLTVYSKVPKNPRGDYLLTTYWII